MSLSKENSDKLNAFIKNKNINKNNISINKKNSDKNFYNLNNSPKANDPNKIFYSIIDNSNNLNETSESNQLLKNSEQKFHDLDHRKSHSAMSLSVEEELYDEFNYLLDE